jgi:hypothetical protein
MNTVVRDLKILFERGSFCGLFDGLLLDHFVERREGAVFGVIVHRHGPMVWGVRRRVLRDHHDAEDAFKATFLVLARKASSVMPRDKLGNWLYGVAYQLRGFEPAGGNKEQRAGWRDVAVRETKTNRMEPYIALGLPQVAFALIGGFLSRKYRITITRRPAQVGAGPATSGRLKACQGRR